MSEVMPECLQEESETTNLQKSEAQKSEAIELIKEDIKKGEEEHSVSTSSSDINVDEIISKHKRALFEMIDEERSIYLQTDKQFFTFLKNFVEIQGEKDRQKVALKEVFFFIVMFSFLLLMVTPLALILSLNDMNQTTAIVSLLTVLVELISAIKILPQIIADYLFNKEEDEKLMEIIESMQNYNQNKHDYISQFKGSDNE